MPTYRITKPYRVMGRPPFVPGQIVTDAELGGIGEHIVKIGRAVRLNIPDPEPETPEDKGEPADGDPGENVTDDDSESTVDVNNIGLPDFNQMNKPQIIAWAEGVGITVNKRENRDTIIKNILEELG